MRTPRKSRRSYPDGVVGVYDNGGKTFDRYTVVFLPIETGGRLYWQYRGMSAHPCHPQGFGQWGESQFRLGRAECGRTIEFSELPEECQRLILHDLREIAECAAA